MKELHDQDWRDFQPVADPDIDSEKFRAALNRAKRHRELAERQGTRFEIGGLGDEPSGDSTSSLSARTPEQCED